VDDIKKEIRDHWFKDHVAALTQHGDLQVIAWRNPKCFSYACRYTFDREFVYISGDIGEAVFRLTWSASIHSFNNIHVHYFHEKLSAYFGSRYKFSSEKAVKGLREWLKDLKENYHRKYDHDEMANLFTEARECSSTKEWAFIVNSHHDFISGLDQDYFEWFYNIGNEIPAKIHAYLIGLQMASEQLAKLEEIKGGK